MIFKKTEYITPRVNPNVYHSGGMSIVGGGLLWEWQGIHGNSLLSDQFFCEPKTYKNVFLNVLNYWLCKHCKYPMIPLERFSLLYITIKNVSEWPQRCYQYVVTQAIMYGQFMLLWNSLLWNRQDSLFLHLQHKEPY